MSFKIKCKTSVGVFHININRDLSLKEMTELTQLAYNITSEERNGSHSYPENSPSLNQNTTDKYGTEKLTNIQVQLKLGENPTKEIKLGDYVEPSAGVRIKMVAFPTQETKIAAVKSFREQTKISLIGSKDVVFGNHPCPILKPAVAFSIMQSFKDIGIFAKIVPASDLTCGQAVL